MFTIVHLLLCLLVGHIKRPSSFWDAFYKVTSFPALCLVPNMSGRSKDGRECYSIMKREGELEHLESVRNHGCNVQHQNLGGRLNSYNFLSTIKNKIHDSLVDISTRSHSQLLKTLLAHCGNMILGFINKLCGVLRSCCVLPCSQLLHAVQNRGFSTCTFPWYPSFYKQVSASFWIENKLCSWVNIWMRPSLLHHS